MPDETASEKSPTRGLPPWAIPLGVLALAAGVFVLVYGDWTRWESDRATQRTNDAYVKADVTPVHTKASGILARLLVADYQHVAAGQLIASLREAALRAVEAGLAELRHQQEVADARMGQARAGVAAAERQVTAAQAGVTASEEAVRIAEAEWSSAQAVLEHATQELDRQQALYAGKAATLQRLQGQQAQTRSAQAGAEARRVGVQAARAQLAARQADVERAKAGLDGARSEGEAAGSARRLLDAKAEEIRADIAARRAAADSTKIAAGYAAVVAPVAGYVASRGALPGQMVTPASTVVSLVAEAPWIQANFKETQLGRVRPGDAAEIEVDMFPGRVWKGRVEALAPATGSATALLAPDNATGNFTKIVQRIPVKIVPDAGQDVKALRPGMSAVVTLRPGQGR